MFLTVDDLSPFTAGVTDAQLVAMIDDVHALAANAAPCLSGDLSEAQRATVRAVLRGAILRWVDHVNRDDRQMSAGPYSIGPAPGLSGERKPLLWPTKIASLQDVCRGSVGRGRAYVGWLA